MTASQRIPKVELPLASDTEVAAMVAGFEACTLPYVHWTHRAHLAVAISYLREMSWDAALARIRERIEAYNRTCGDPDGYNETVTQAFLRKVASESTGRPRGLAIHAEVARLAEVCSLDWLYRHYSRERIWSEGAKRAWLAPDIAPFDF